jgi:CDP-glycerol glycerophosphotransferase (TagB/SpsB family)
LESGYRVIFRPHPQSYVSDATIIADVSSRYANNQLFRIDRNIESTDSMLESTVLISDISGVRFDYSFIYGKPVLTIQSMMNTEEYEISVVGLDEPWEVLAPQSIGKVISIEEADTIVSHIQNIMNRPKEESRDFRDEWIDNFGHAGTAVAQWLVSMKDCF